MPRFAQKLEPPESSNWRGAVMVAFDAAHHGVAVFRCRGGSAASSAYTSSTVYDRAAADATTEPGTAATAVTTPFGLPVPSPVANAAASRLSLASARSGPTSAANPESARTSKEPCTQAAAFSGLMD